METGPKFGTREQKVMAIGRSSNGNGKPAGTERTKASTISTVDLSKDIREWTEKGGRIIDSHIREAMVEQAEA